MTRLAVTVIARNEERDLPDCLRSVSFADDVLVVDSGSTDRTREIAREMGARVIENPWPGYAAQKRFAMEKTQGDWVLNLDADERVSLPLRDAIATAITREAVDGYLIRFQTSMFGRRVRFGGLGCERHLRLFRKAKASYPEVCVHEGVVIDGAIAQLEEPILHDPYASLEEYFEKFNHYTSQMALERFKAGRRFSAFSALRWPWGFFRRYVLQLGFLDGYAGFLNASLSGLYDFVKYAKIHDLERKPAALPPAPEG